MDGFRFKGNGLLSTTPKETNEYPHVPDWCKLEDGYRFMKCGEQVNSSCRFFHNEAHEWTQEDDQTHAYVCDKSSPYACPIDK